MGTNILSAAFQRRNHEGSTILTSPRLAATANALFAMAVCYFRTFVSFDLPILPRGDQLGFVVHGSRIVAGQLPYRDYFLFVAPGTDLVYALLIKCFGLRIWLPHFAMISLAGMAVALMTLIAARFMSGTIIWLPGLLFTGLVLLGSLDATHHWFSTVAVMAAITVLLDGTTALQIAIAGALCGLTASFTQTKGAVVTVAFAAYILWKTQRQGESACAGWRKCLLLCGAALAVFFAVNLPVIVAAGFGRWFYCLVVYPLRYYSAPNINNWRVLEYDSQSRTGFTRWFSVPAAYAVPFVYAAFAVAMRRLSTRDRNAWHDELVLVLLAGVAMFLAISTSPSVKRIETASPPATILVVFLLNRSEKVMTAGSKVVLGVAAVALAIGVPLRQQMRSREYLDLPAGRTAFFDRGEFQEYGWVLEHSQAGQYFYGTSPMYLPFHFLNPSAIEGLDTSEYTRPEQVAELVRALGQHPVTFMILPSSKNFPRDAVSSSNHLGPFQDYLRKNYRFTRVFSGGDELWERIQSDRNGALGRASLTD
jgi:hypothetical protein